MAGCTVTGLTETGELITGWMEVVGMTWGSRPVVPIM